MSHASEVALAVKNHPASSGDAGEVGSVPGLGRAPGEGNGNLLQYCCQWAGELGRLPCHIKYIKYMDTY